jgi:hypothetical protein
MKINEPTIRVLSCRSCGHLFDADKGDYVVGYENIVIEEKDRNHEDCKLCLEKDRERNLWPRG